MQDEHRNLDSIRLRHLQENIRQDLELLKEYEDVLLLEDEPSRKKKYLLQIERLRSFATRHQEEYHDLQARMAAGPPGQLADVGNQLREMDTKLDAVLAGQTAIHASLGDLRATFLSRFDRNEQTIIAALLERLDEEQIKTSQAVLDAILAGHISESLLQEALEAVQQVFAALRQRELPIPQLSADESSRIAKTIAEPTLDTSHKLAISIPLIPFLLSYEGEISMQGFPNLKAAWRHLVTKVRGKP